MIDEEERRAVEENWGRQMRRAVDTWVSVCLVIFATVVLEVTVLTIIAVLSR